MWVVMRIIVFTGRGSCTGARNAWKRGSSYCLSPFLSADGGGP